MSDVLQNLLRQDTEFSEAKFKSKVENEFVKIELSIVTGKVEAIKHCVSDEVYAQITNKVQEDINNNRIQMYDELNVADVRITNIEELEDRFRIYVNVHSKTLIYYLNRATRKFMSGNNKYRVDRNSILIFEKIKDARALGQARKCPYCAANLDLNNNGKCNYCGAIFPLQNYDWVITKMDI